MKIALIKWLGVLWKIHHVAGKKTVFKANFKYIPFILLRAIHHFDFKLFDLFFKEQNW